MVVTKLHKTVKSKGQGKYESLRFTSVHETTWTGKNKTGIKDCLDEMLSSFIWLG